MEICKKVCIDDRFYFDELQMKTCKFCFSDEKGNSLFAEVDDQRQQMKQVLAFQKEEYQKV